MLERNQIYLGDCLEIMKDIPDKSVDMILCDLPYGITGCKWDSVIPLESLWIQYKRIIKKGGTIVLTAVNPFAANLITTNYKWYRHEFVWQKSNHSNPLNAKHMPLRIHELVLIFSENPPKYYPQGLIEVNKITKQGIKVSENIRDAVREKEYFQKYSNYPKSIQYFKNQSNTVHSTQKPVKLFEWIIKTYSLEGDLVLDNCAGSGTTAIACLNTNRDYILIEKEQKYFDICKERIDKHVVQKTLLD